eukprot:8137759-Pyramimonas_sp.AAC.1
MGRSGSTQKQRQQAFRGAPYERPPAVAERKAPPGRALPPPLTPGPLAPYARPPLGEPVAASAGVAAGLAGKAAP